MGAEFKKLKNGSISLVEILRDPSETPLRRARLYDLLRRSPHLSDKGAKKICLETKLWPLDRVEDIDLFMREEIIKALPPRAR